MGIETVVNTVGPVGEDWEWTLLESVADMHNHHALVEIKARRRFVDATSKSFSKLTLTQWGSAPKSDPRAARIAENNAVTNGLVWLGLLPDLAIEYGIDHILSTFGPVGVNWGFEITESNWPQGCLRAEVWVKKSAVSFGGRHKFNVGINRKGKAPTVDEDDDEKKQPSKRESVQKGYVEFEQQGYCDPSAPNAEMMALADAVSSAMAWLKVAPEKEAPNSSQKSKAFHATKAPSTPKANPLKNFFMGLSLKTKATLVAGGILLLLSVF